MNTSDSERLSLTIISVDAEMDETASLEGGSGSDLSDDTNEASDSESVSDETTETDDGKTETTDAENDAETGNTASEDGKTETTDTEAESESNSQLDCQFLRRNVEIHNTFRNAADTFLCPCRKVQRIAAHILRRSCHRRCRCHG